MTVAFRSSSNHRTLVALAVASAFASSGAALAQAPAQKIDKIEVTGSNIKRIEGESALPVTVITRDEISRSGVTTAAELLDKISASNAGGYSVAQAVGDSATPGLSAASLRGLGSTNTLILLNGRRLSNYAFNASGGGTVNLNQIPLAAIERVEVLKDGASAIYGTDAIGGVINFILRKDFTGAEVSAYGTMTDQGGGNTRKYSGTIGLATSTRTASTCSRPSTTRRTRRSRPSSARASPAPAFVRTWASRRPRETRRPPTSSSAEASTT